MIWDSGPSTAEQIRDRMAATRPLKDSTIRTLLRRLIDKGYVEFSVEGRTYLYSARVKPGTAAATAVRRIIDRFCGGSVERLLVGLVDGDIVDEKELKHIAEKIGAAKAKRSRK